MNPIEPIHQKRYHLVGVAGVGMSALAQVILGHGHFVTGSDRFFDDRRSLDVFGKLRVGGVQLVPQDGSGVSRDTDAIIVSAAIESDNADLLAAKKNNIPVIHRADMLASLAAGARLIGVTGTSGKTTVTGMVGWILECLGQDPTVVNGGCVVNWRSENRMGNVRLGRSNLWVVELDESDRSLLRFSPDWAVVNNISKDHFELLEAQSLFREFAAKVRVGIVCGKGVSRILRSGPRKGSAAEIVEHSMDLFEESGRFGFRFKGQSFLIPLIGRHNAENASITVALCDLLGLDLIAVRDALHRFAGIGRRMEKVGEDRGITVVDDYAHNPAKIRAGWEALAPAYRRVIGVWRPHGYGPLASMLNELTDTFAGICRQDDRVFVLPVFYAGGTANKKVTSEDLVSALKSKRVPAELVETYDALADRLRKEARSGDAILCMGARDPDLPLFARRIFGILKPS